MIKFITKKWIAENKVFLALFFVGLVFFIGCSGFYGFLPDKFNSPDETANYFFIKTYSESGQMKSPEPLNAIFENHFHPRSMTVVNNHLVPGGFLGLIFIYGVAAKLFGLRIVYFLAPLFTILSAFCFYQIVKKVFDKSVATISSFLFLIHPAVLYYSARGLFPNILFVSFLVISVFFLVNKPFQNLWKYLDFISAGLFLGITISIRPSEIIWIFIIYFLLFFFYRKEINYKQILFLLGSFFVAILPLFLFNFLIYGHPFSSAYNPAVSGEGADISQKINWFAEISKYIFPFGFHPKSIFKVFSNYFLGIFWWLTIPVAFSAMFFIKKAIYRKIKKEILVYLLICVPVSFFIFSYYGSWIFSDNQTSTVSIGTSYIRYWLPIYIFVLPLIALFFKNIVNLFSGRKRQAVILFLIITCFLFSLKIVLFDSSDGLIKIYRDIKKSEVIFYEVNKLIEQDAIIIVDRADKIFFPEFKVAYPLRDDKTYRLIPRFSKIAPLYYYGITLPEKDMDYLNREKLGKNNMKIVLIENFCQESLYKLVGK